MSDTASRMDQVAERARGNAATIESQRAQLAAIQSRLTTLESQLEGTQSSALDSTERIERLAIELDVSARLDALEARLAAAQSAQAQSASRLEQQAVDLGQIGHVEAAVSQLRTELIAQIDAHHRDVASELGDLRDARMRDAAESARTMQTFDDRLAVLGEITGRLSSLERREADSADALAKLTVRVEEVASQRGIVEERFRRVEQSALAHIEGLSSEITTMADEVSTWRARIDAQSETVREARAVAAAMGEEAKRMADAHHATAEAQRIAEGRVDAALAAAREQAEQEWERFRAERGKDWSAAEQEAAARDARLDVLEAGVPPVHERIDALEADLLDRIEVSAEALLALRREVVATVDRWREAMAEDGAQLAQGLPSEEQPGVSAERRRATRRALRARRATREG